MILKSVLNGLVITDKKGYTMKNIKKVVMCTDLPVFKSGQKPADRFDRHYLGVSKAHKVKKGSEAYKAFIEGRY